MGAIIGKQRRYMNGMQPSEYWDEVAWPENKETLEVLRFTHDQALIIFKAFVDVDRDNSGEVRVTRLLLVCTYFMPSSRPFYLSNFSINSHFLAICPLD